MLDVDLVLTIVTPDSIMCDTLGLYARSTADLQLLLDVFAVQDDAQPADVVIKGSKFAFAKTHVWPKASPALQGVWEDAKRYLTEAGAEVEEIQFPAVFDNLGEWHR